MVDNHFPTIRLGEYCLKIGSGATPRGGSEVYLQEGNTTLIRSQNIQNLHFDKNGLVFIEQKHADQLSNVVVCEDDILLNITGDSVARCCQVIDEVLPARVNQHVAIIRPDQSVLDPQFLCYFLASTKMQNFMLQLSGAGATRNALTKGMIESFEVPAPTLSIQRRIAHILGTLDDKIELNRRMNETLESIAQTLFKSWFIDFDPVKAKASGRKPEGISEEIAALFPDSFEDSEMGRIPKGWKCGHMKNICSVLGGYAYKSKDFSNNGFPLIKISNIQENKIVNTNNVQYIPNSVAEKTKDFWLRTGNLVMAMTGATVGKFGLISTTNDSPCLLNQRVAKFHADTFISSKIWFIYCYLNQNSVINQITNAAHGSAQANISANDIMSIKLVQPPNKLISIFNEKIDIFFEKYLMILKSNHTLTSIRDTLLPKLISGEIRSKTLKN